MLERDLQKKCVEYLKREGIYYLNIHGGGWGTRGAPDLLACIAGRFVAFELKVGSNQMAPAQKIHKGRIEASGGRHYVPRSLEEFKRMVEEAKHAS